MSYLQITYGVISLAVLVLILYGKVAQAGVIAFAALIVLGGYERIKQVRDSDNQDSAAPTAKTSSTLPAIRKKPAPISYKKLEKILKPGKNPSIRTNQPPKPTWKNPPRR